MRFYTLAWFYNAQDTLLHIRSLQYDPNTPHRVSNDLFGGTEINGFEYDLKLHAQTRVEDLSYTALMGEHVPFFREYQHEIVQGSALTDNYQIKFTYCCGEIHFHEGNRFAKHQRCVPFEPTESQISDARGRETMAQLNATKQQEAQETTRISMPAPSNQTTPIVHRFDVTAPSEFNGKAVSPGGLDEVSFHVVEETQSVDTLIDSLYKEPSEVTRTHFKLVNNHLSNNIVLPAQVVLLSAEDNIRCTDIERHMRSELHIIENYRQNMRIDAPDFSKNFIDYANVAGMAANGVSFGTTYFQQHIKQIQKVLTELQNAYTKDFRMPGGALRYRDMEAYRIKKFKELNALTTKSMQTKFYKGIGGPKLARKLRLKPQLIEHDWRIKKSKIIPSLSKFYENTAKFSKSLKIAGYIAVPLAAYETYDHIVQACTDGEEACTQAKYVEWSAFAGSLAGGALGSIGGEMAGVALVFFFGVTGLAVVGIVATAAIVVGVGGTYAGKIIGEGGGERLYHNADKIISIATGRMETKQEKFLWVPKNS